jgi:transmembrane sensor
MEAEKFKKYQTTEEFILDKDFTYWVLHPDKELDRFWQSFINENPEKEAQIRDAVLIIKSLKPSDQEVPQERLDAILRKLRRPDKKINLNRFSYLKYAAGIAIFATIGSILYLSVHNRNNFPIEAANETTLKGKVILANGSIREFDSEQTPIKQTTAGNLIVNNDTIDVGLNQTKTAMNQIIIPYGKRSDIVLADGTHIWLNSGSQLSYPSEFKTDSREVYLSGEAFFDVIPNPDKPFYVITREIKIKVLGTSFNVSSYGEDYTAQTVLVKGKITAGKNKLFAGTIEMEPGERLTYDKNDAHLSKDKVDVQLYTSWVNGYLLFLNAPIKEVSIKLERFYNQRIVIEGGLEKITFSGKLDLKNKLNEVLENIAFASSVKVLEENGTFIIKE